MADLRKALELTERRAPDISLRLPGAAIASSRLSSVQATEAYAVRVADFSHANLPGRLVAWSDAQMTF